MIRIIARTRNYKKLTALFSLFFLLTFSGCAHYRSVSYPAPEALPKDLAAYYQFPAVSFYPEPVIWKETADYVIKRVEFPLSVPDELAPPDWRALYDNWAKQTEKDKRKGADLAYKVRVDFYELRGGEKRPLVIISPILGGDNQVATIFAGYFAGHGVHTAIIHREKAKFPEQSEPDDLERYLRMSVMRALQGTNWLFTQPTVDTEHVGTFGISFGGIMNTFLAALDKRLSCHVIAMAGGNLAHIIVRCPENSIQPYVKNMMKKHGWTRAELQSKLHHTLKTDTLVFGKAIAPDSVLMFIGLFDRVVGRKNGRNLWKAMGEPETVFFPFGHYTSVLAMPYIATKALKFYRQKFYGPEPLGNQGNFAGGIFIPHEKTYDSFPKSSGMEK